MKEMKFFWKWVEVEEEESIASSSFFAVMSLTRDSFSNSQVPSSNS